MPRYPHPPQIANARDSRLHPLALPCRFAEATAVAGRAAEGCTAKGVSRFRCAAAGSHGGFALVIALVLLAFLVLLFLSLSALTQVELQSADKAGQSALARQNALVGLNVALGRLQQLSGQDQRVTATADILAGRHNDRAHWTGVWNTDTASDDYGKNIGWLVSGGVAAGVGNVGSAVSAASGQEVVELVGEGSVVNAERVRVGSEGVDHGGVKGSFAYWVGDEGVKAKVNLIDPHADKPAAERIYSFALSQRMAGERMAAADGNALGGSYPVNAEGLALVGSGRDFPLAATATAQQERLKEAAKTGFHDMTFNARSIPADVVTGGLKKDLSAWLSSATPASGAPADSDFIIGSVSASDSVTDRLPRWGLVRSYAGLTTSGGASVSPQVQTDTQMGLYPVVTYVRLGFGVSCAGDGQPLKVHLFPEVVLWNPYNVPLAAAKYRVGVRLSNSINFETVDGTVKETLNLTRAALGVTTTWPQEYFKFEIDVTNPIPAGQSIVFTPDFAEKAYGDTTAYLTAQNPPRYDGSLVMTSTKTLSTEQQQAGLSWSSPPAAEAYIGLWPENSDVTDTADAYQSVSRIGHAAVPAISTEPVLPVILAPRMQYRILATMSRGPASHISPRWMAQQNMRAPVIDRSGAETGTLPLFYCLTGTGATTINVDGNRASAGLSVSRVTGSADSLVLYELPPAGLPLFSLAQLQHANLAPAGYYSGYAVGNSLPQPAVGAAQTERKDDSWSRAVHDLSYKLNNVLWDKYFFSTVPSNFSQANLDSKTYRLPNGRHVLERSGTPTLQALSGADAFHTAAAHLWVDGGFNINSTSVEAWKALLGGRNGLAYDPVSRSTGTALEYPFSRFSVPAGSPNEAWEGYRTLSAEAIDSLAAQIVEQVKARGPFLSLADFINRSLENSPLSAGDDRYAGVLQAALEAHDEQPDLAEADAINLYTPFNADPVASTAGTSWDLSSMQGGATAAFPRSSRSAFAPGYLSQADILNAIGPFLTPRSDTFVIRAYGDVRNPVSGEIEARAWCEAVVQRTHNFFNFADRPEAWPVTNAENLTFGRRYQVIAFRWLTQEEI